MTLSQKVKSAGFNSLKELSELINKSRQTIGNWEKDSPELFNAVLVGALLIKLGKVSWLKDK